MSRLRRLFSSLDLEERILNVSALVSIIFVFFPWIAGEWGDDQASFSGIEFFTSFIGWTIILLHLSLIAIILVPALGGPMIIGKRHRDVVRLCIAGIATILSLAALSVLINITYEYARLEIRYSIYLVFVGSIIATFYSFWKMQEQHKHNVHEVFQYPESIEPREEVREMPFNTPPPPPPPAPLEPEDYRV